ncbi:TonB-dependent receptor [Lysobacter sp. A6]|uniref:TonB-dependent receptor n=1 Tax=Noviluteimonas lactosilytica TaxID=2888523 RepID=A0ABS8JJU9_9GAMM|nr:TonB-dependent receptor [Lysobacter lactosilyticus]MCC8363869.1 TonB-dependent receptor [Lysobacter lactosilyticus]
MTDRNRVRLSKLSVALIAALAAAPVFAQSTSAGLGGRVLDASGQPVAGAQVTILHAESNTSSTVTTDANGRFSARGLRVGGPYTITATSAAGTDIEQGIYLQLSAANNVNLELAAAATQLDAVTVTGTPTVFSPDKMGTGTSLTRAQIEAAPSINRNIQDSMRLDPRVVQTSKADGAISAGGQNSRYNAIRVDGVSVSDTFGLEANNMQTRRQPVSIDAIEAMTVDLANYDVTITGATGAVVDAVTKSGTNDFHGTVYGVYRNDSMVGDNPDGSDFTGFNDEKTYGATFGGPLMKDKLFFFFNYEKFEQGAPGPNLTAGPLGNGQITRDDVAEIQDIAQSVYGFDAGALGADSLETSVEEYALKLDWNITDTQRASFRYSTLDQNTARVQGFSGTTASLSSNWFNHLKTVDSYVGQLFSDWTDTLSTELKVSYREYAAVRDPLAKLPSIRIGFGDVTVDGLAGSPFLDFGTELNTHYNLLETETWDTFGAANWYLGDHTVKFGFDYESNDIYNLFGPQQFGVYEFNSIEDFRNGTWSHYQLRTPQPGQPLDSIAAKYTHENLGLFAQDTWNVSPNLTLNFGLRVDTPMIDDVPQYNAVAQEVYGYDNSVTIDGQELWQPRFGFNYTFDSERPTQLRGGIGLFGGAAAEVWIGNSFSATGLNVVQYDQFFDDDENSEQLPFNPDPLNPPVPANPAFARMNVNFMSPDLEQPSVWKTNLAFDTELPWFGAVFSAELLLTEVKTGLAYDRLDIGAPTGVGQDGRLLYWRNPVTGGGGARANRDSRFGDVILLRPTDKGRTQQMTFGLEKPVDDVWGWSLSYTWTDATEVSPLLSSTATSNFNNRSIFQPNEDVASTSNFEIKDRVLGTITWHHNFFSDYRTEVSGVYEGRSGRPYSWVYSNDTNGDSRVNDLFYVPAGRGDVLFTGGAAMEDAFFQYLSTTDIANSMGSVVSRNSSRAGWVNSFDLRISQELPGFFEGHKSQIWLDVMNIGNLINNDWGQINDYGFFADKSILAYAGIDEATGKYIYNFDPARVEQAVAANTNGDGINVGVSQWSLQVGFRYEF